MTKRTNLQELLDAARANAASWQRRYAIEAGDHANTKAVLHDLDSKKDGNARQLAEARDAVKRLDERLARTVAALRAALDLGDGDGGY